MPRSGSADPVAFAVREAYAAHELLCQIGYDPEDIFVGAAPVIGEPTPCAIVWLRHGGLELTMPVAALSQAEAKRFKGAMEEFIAKKPTMARSELDAWVRESTVWSRAGEVLAVLARKGFDIERWKRREAN